jgi:hypothetical protein
MLDQLIAFDVDVIDQTDPADLAENRLELNITNALEKLDKYRQLLTSPIYLASVVLMPWYKWTYFEDTLKPSELQEARTKVLKLWNESYASIVLEADDIPPSTSQSSRVCLFFLIYKLN